MANVIQGDPVGQGRRIAIVASRFNELITGRLVDGALDTLVRQGVARDHVALVWVPGAFELPLACRWLAASGRYDALVALGAVIRGATSHYEHVCNQAARGVLDSGLSTSVPIAFGVLTCETLEDALERAGGSAGNKGAEAALAALEMAALRAVIDGRSA
jgi:6,7-dimethyl-8-ribityllumazine synthase